MYRCNKCIFPNIVAYCLLVTALLTLQLMIAKKSEEVIEANTDKMDANENYFLCIEALFKYNKFTFQLVLCVLHNSFECI